MQAYAVEFAPAQLNPLRITDAIPAERLPFPHVCVGNPAEEKGQRIPLTARLAASFAPGEALICRASAYRDPKAGKIVLGVEHSPNGEDPRALVLLAVSSSFPDGVSVSPQKGIAVLARGEIRYGQQLLLLWPEGGRIAVEDPVREEGCELYRTGNQFIRVKAQK